MADANFAFRSAVPAGPATTGATGDKTDEYAETRRVYGELPKTARHLLPSLPLISAESGRDSRVLVGLRANECFVQKQDQQGTYELQKATMAPALRAAGWANTLAQGGFHHASGLMFCLLTEAEITAMGGRWSEAHIKGLRCVGALEAPKRDALLKDLEDMLPSQNEPELEATATEADKEAAKAEWKEQVTAEHAFRMISAVHMLSEALGAGKPAVAEYLFAVRGEEDLDIIIESLAEKVRDMDPIHAESAGGPGAGQQLAPGGDAAVPAQLAGGHARPRLPGGKMGH